MLTSAHTALHTLARLNQLVSSSLDMDEVLHEIAHAAATLMNAPFVHLLIADEATHTLESRAFSDPQLGADLPLKKVPFAQGGVGWVATHRRPLQVVDVFTDAEERFLALDWWRAHGLRSFLAVPIVFEDVLLGVLALNSSQPFNFGPDEQYLLTSFAAQAAIALNNARLFKESQTQAAMLAQANAALQREIAKHQHVWAELETRALQQAVIAALGQRALRDTNVAVLLDEVVRRVAPTLNVEYCMVLELLPDGSAMRICAAVGLPQELIGQAVLKMQADSHAGYTLRVGEPVVVDDLRTETRFTPQVIQHYGVVSCMSAIIHSLGRPFGILGAYTTRPRTFTSDDVHFLEAVANVLAGAIARQCLDEQVRQGQKLQAIGTLAGGIAHDFNNMLTAILGYTELASDDVPRDSLTWHNLQRVLAAGTRARDLVQQLLAFSRQNTTQLQPVELPLLVREMLSLLRASLPSTIEIRQHIETDVGLVMAAPTQIHQVLLNLCTNAEHAMRATGGVLEVRLEAVEVDAAFAAAHPELKPGPHVRLTVCDTGHGMSPEVLERIYDPFFTTKGVGEGTGMGLSVTHGIVASHGGTMTVVSALDKGTTFALYLPCSASPASRPAPAPEPIPRGYEHILFVDDEVTLVQLGQELLTRLGYTVTGHTSSVEALAAFRAAPHRFDLVITDQTMPTMTGEGLVRALRDIRPDLPVVLCTGFSYAMTKDKAAALGIDAFLLKPLVAQDLARTIRQVLAARLKAEG
jgi:signal transduction histidine kinase/ActR/RegA family two-component response regulator